jgi:hypothetical protein
LRGLTLDHFQIALDLVKNVFISYRRDLNAGDARALCNDLSDLLGSQSVFMDVDSIAPGCDFREVLKERLASCDLMLVLIGRDWLDAKDSAGQRRLEQPNDFVRQEIATALARNIPSRQYCCRRRPCHAPSSCRMISRTWPIAMASS